jgi:hypothetical protein
MDDLLISIHTINIMTSQDNTVICTKCNRTDKECEEQAEDKDNRNLITVWMPHNWGLSCDECYFKNRDECEVLSDDDCGKEGKFMDKECDKCICGSLENDDDSINTQEECCECYLTEKQYNKKKGYESNLSTLHYIAGNTYCPDCRDPENSDDEDNHLNTSLE